MTNRLEILEHWTEGLLGLLEPKSRHKLVRSLGQELRRSQQKRIIAQQNPDGTKYVSRKKTNLYIKHLPLKRKASMFKALRTQRLLKTKIKDSEIIIGFGERTARISRVHQFGLKELNIIYKRRQILGLTDFDIASIRSKLLEHITHTEK